MNQDAAPVGILAKALGIAVPDDVARAHEYWDDCRITVDAALVDAGLAEVEYLQQLRGWLGGMDDFPRWHAIARLRKSNPPAPVMRVLKEME